VNTMIRVPDKDILEAEEMLITNLSIAYCQDPGGFENDIQCEDKYNSGILRDIIHKTLKKWGQSEEYIRRRSRYHDVDEYYKE